MLLNLGLTADAAAAHGNEFTDSSQASLSSNPKPSPSVVSFAKTPLLGLGSFYNSFKGSEPPEPPNKQNPSMPTSHIDSRSSSDGESSVVESTIAPRPTRSAPKKQTSRPKTSYYLAHPAGHARHKRLKLRPKLLLQLQQSSHTTRPLPILDVLPSSVHLPKLTRKFPTIFRGKNGLGPNDLIIVTSDLYGNELDKAKKHKGEGKEDEHQEVIATICQLLTEDALSKGKAEICLNYGPIWEATPLPNGSYEFAADTDNGRQIMRWVQRPNKNRRVSGTTLGPAPQEETKRFTFSVINPNTRRHPVVASMTRNHLEVFDEYSTPSSVSKPPTSGMSMISDDSQVDDRNMVPMDDKLRTLIVITSIWVAFREGWSHNFTYDDSASALNSKAICSPISSKHNSPTAATAENDVFPEDDGRHPNLVTTNGSKHLAFANRQSHTAPDMDVSKPTSSGKLNKRSNSTGANFLKRNNRQTARPSRHSMLPPTKDNHGITPNSVQPEDEYFTVGAENGNAKHAKGPDRAVDAHAETLRGTNGTTKPRVPETNGIKPKRRHRFSNILDLFSRRH